MRIGKPNGLSSISLNGTNIRQVSGQILGVDYYGLDKTLFTGMNVAPLPITGCRVSKASATEINFATGFLSCPDSTSAHTQHLWASASNQALSTIKLSGTVGANQTWYLYAYMASDTARILTPAASMSAPASVPNGRLLGWLTTDGSNNIDKVWQWNQPDTVEAYNSANQSISNNSPTVVTFNSEVWDTNSLHSTSSNTSRLTAAKDGLYYYWAQCTFATESAANLIKIAAILLNGTNYIARDSDRSLGGGALTHGFNLSGQEYLYSGDYIELQVYQNTGGALNLLADGAASPFRFGMTLQEYV